MAKSDNGSGFDWDMLWAAWAIQPMEIRRYWMAGENGLGKALKESMERYPEYVQDEMFSFAPLDVQQYFGYVSNETKAIQDRKRQTSYRSPLLDKIKGITA